MVDKDKQKQVRMENATKQLLEMRVYDVLNMLGNMMMDNETSEEELVIKCINGLTNKENLLSIRLEEVNVEDEWCD